MKFRTRILLVCLVVVIGVVILNTTILMVYVSNSLKENAVKSSQAVNKQSLIVFDNLMTSLDNLSQVPIMDEEVFKILDGSYEQYPEDMKKFQMYRDSDKVSEKLYTSIFYNNKYINSVTLIPFNSSMIYSKNRYSAPVVNDVKNEFWYDTLYNSDGKSIIIPLHKDTLYAINSGNIISEGRLIMNARTNRKLGILKIDVKIDDLSNLWENESINEGTQILVLNNENKIIYSSYKDDNENTSTNIIKQVTGGKLNIEDKNEKYLATLTKSDITGCSIIMLTPKDTIYREAYTTMIIMIFVAAFCIGIAFILSEMMSRHIMKPIKSLNNTMIEARKGDLSVRSDVTSKGEFGELCCSFNLMIDNTQELINEIYKEEQKKREMEYKALQAQISPHFILNTLNAIKLMATMQGAKSIETSIDSMAHIISFAIKDKSDKITIEIEIKQIEYYIQILSLRYYNKFNIKFDVEDKVLYCYTLKYMLQPIMENCIFHGFDGIEGKGNINVKIYIENNKIIYEVLDNGNGISDELIDNILLKEDVNSGFNKIGIYNVNKRIKMIYGEEFGVEIKSCLGEFTLVKITIPIEKGEDDD